MNIPDFVLSEDFTREVRAALAPSEEEWTVEYDLPVQPKLYGISPIAQAAMAVVRSCAKCGAPFIGPHCIICGDPTKPEPKGIFNSLDGTAITLPGAPKPLGVFTKWSNHPLVLPTDDQIATNALKHFGQSPSVPKLGDL